MTFSPAHETMDEPDRSFRLVPFGTYTRTLILAQLGHIGTVVTALLIIALTLDIAPSVERILEQAGPLGTTGLVVYMLRYVLLRACDNLGTLLPLACFMGVCWSEIMLTQSRERIAIWNGGRTPLQSLMPLAVLGIVLGGMQVTALMVLRPTAVAAQIEEGIGSYGRRFDRSLKAERRWITLPGHMVQARIDYRNARLVDVQIFELSDEGRMTGRIEAASAEPDGTPGHWLLRQGSRWIAPAEGTLPPAGGPAVVRFAEERIVLPLDPLWVRYLGIEPRYLTQDVLSELARRSLIDDPSYRTWWHVRLAQAILPFGMMLMASALAVRLIAQRTAFKPTLLVGLAGYFLHVSNNFVVWLGHYGQLNPALAAWIMPLAMTAAGLALMLRLQREGSA